MAAKIQVVMNGEPLADAQIVFGEIGTEEKTTDKEGLVDFKTQEPWTGYVEVLITWKDIVATSKVKIKAGEITIIDLGEIEQP